MGHVASQRNEKMEVEMAVDNQEVLANASIEQITAMALAKINGEELGDETGFEADDGTGGMSEEFGASGTEGKQNVEQASFGQPAGEVPAGKSNKEMNFAALRAKTQQLSDDLAASQQQVKQLSDRGTFKSSLPEDHGQRMADVEGELTSIGKSFQDGDLTWDEYQLKLREASAVRESLVESATMAKISKQMQEQEAVNKEQAGKDTWANTVKSFIDSKPDGMDYSDPTKNRDLDVYVKALAADADNADKPGEWFLNEAHALVKSKHRITTIIPPAKPPAKEEMLSASKPFQTLSDVPGGLPAGTNEVEQLGDMSGAALANRFMNDPGGIDKLLASLG